MANLVFYMEYGPLISRAFKSAFLVYMYYDKLQNDNGVVQITYNELYDHLGLATSTIQKSNALLKKLNLIEEVESPTGKRYKLLPVKKLSSELRADVLKATNTKAFSEETELKRRYLSDDIPPDYQQLLNKKVLKAAYKELGTLKKIKDLCKHFKIDYYSLKLLLERDGEDSFKQKYKALVKQIEPDTPKESKKPKAKRFGTKEIQLATYLYDKLKALGVTPIRKDWFPKNSMIAKNVLQNITLEEAQAALDFGFADSWWADKIHDLTCIDKLHSRNKLKAKKCNKPLRSTPIPESIQCQIAEEISSNIQVHTYEDAAFLKQSILDGQANQDINKIVSILEKGGIIPSGDENINFG